MNSLYLLYSSLLQLLNTNANIDTQNSFDNAAMGAPNGWTGSMQLSPLSSSECGRIDSSQTILFGDQGYNIKASDADEWPWIAKIRHPNQPNRSECHGVLIDRQHILTASTCVTKIQPTDIVVRLGPYRLAENHFLGKAVSVTDIFVRGRFRTEKTKEHSRKLRHNTAIIRLKEPVDFDHFTRPICLTGAFDSIRSEITDVLKPGTLMNGVDYKRQLIPIWTPEECQVGGTEFCAGFRFSHDYNCPGLPGDPIIVETKDDRWIMIGMATSSSPSCAGPRIYTRISANWNWIHRIISLPVEKPTLTPTAVGIHNTSSSSTETTTFTEISITESIDTTTAATSFTESTATTTASTATEASPESSQPTTINIETTDVTTEITTEDATEDSTAVMTTTKKPFQYLGCGIDYSVETRIVGGQPAKEGKWPWMAAIIRQTRLGLIQYCGAVLIADHYVLSAAHCVKGKAAKDLRVRLGEHDFYDLSNQERDYIVEDILMHENYNDRTFNNDIALLRLRTKVKYNEYIRPICLPPADMPTPVERGSYITGWGHTSSDGSWSPVLREVIIPVLSTERCQEIYRRYGYSVSENQICAGLSEGGKDSCQGDSGGPLMLQLEDGKWIVVGVVSWGIGCADPNFPGVYTSTSYFLNWINDRIYYNQTQQ